VVPRLRILKLGVLGPKGRHIPCRWCEPPVIKRCRGEGPQGRHKRHVSARRALEPSIGGVPVAHATGSGCVVPLALKSAQLENLRIGLPSTQIEKHKSPGNRKLLL